MLYGYYDYTPDDPIVQYITEEKPQVIHLYNRDGVYKGTIADPLIVSRSVRNWRNETVPAIKLFLVLIAECFPEKIEKREGMPNIPEWHPFLPPSDTRGIPAVKFLSGPHLGGAYRSREICQYLLMKGDQEFGDDWHLYELQLNPTQECGYAHIMSGSTEEINKYCNEHKIRNMRE